MCQELNIIEKSKDYTNPYKNKWDKKVLFATCFLYCIAKIILLKQKLVEDPEPAPEEKKKRQKRKRGPGLAGPRVGEL